MTAFAGLVTGRRLIRIPDVAAKAQTADDAVQARLHRQPTAASAVRRSLLHRIPAWSRSDRPTTTSTGLATTAYQELAAAPRADLIMPGDPGHDEAPQSLSQRC
jgi:hypothetical protein